MSRPVSTSHGTKHPVFVARLKVRGEIQSGDTADAASRHPYTSSHPNPCVLAMLILYQAVGIIIVAVSSLSPAIPIPWDLTAMGKSIVRNKLLPAARETPVVGGEFGRKEVAVHPTGAVVCTGGKSGDRPAGNSTRDHWICPPPVSPRYLQWGPWGF